MNNNSDDKNRDIFSEEKRSEIMSKVKSQNTDPEMRARSLLHRMGYRFRLHRDDLPGTPDIVLPKYETVIFVHGCFWHQHPDCKRATVPQTNREYWTKKFANNKRRDERVRRELKEDEWRVLILWECELSKNMEEAVAKIKSHFPK